MSLLMSNIFSLTVADDSTFKGAIKVKRASQRCKALGELSQGFYYTEMVHSVGATSETLTHRCRKLAGQRNEQWLIYACRAPVTSDGSRRESGWRSDRSGATNAADLKVCSRSFNSDTWE